MEIILALDPGTFKCGLALLDKTGQIIFRKIVSPEKIAEEIKALLAQYQPELIVLGQGTGLKKISEKISSFNLPVVKIQEKFSSLEARRLYWQLNQPKGWRKFIPRGLLLPPEPIDDLAAVVIGQQFLGVRHLRP